MLTIRVPGTSLKKARTALGWSLQELAARSGVNWLTIKKYEGAGEYLPPATVGTLNRLVDALEDAGVRFDADGAHLDRATQPVKVSTEIDREVRQ
jgi:transcriptional regulator with XRE-family HTH domain